MNPKFEIDIKELQKAKLFCATPMYGGVCTGTFAQSMNDLCTVCAKNAIPLQFFYLYNESLIQRARNYCVDEFLRSDATHMIFIDADISFNPISVLQLLAISLTDPDSYDILGGPYSKKSISWNSVATAVQYNLVAPSTVNQLEYYAGDMVLNFIPGPVSFKMDEPVPVLETGTGFMLIPRRVFDQWKEAYPEMSYLPDHLGTANFSGDRAIHAYFHCDIDPVTRRYLSEDYYFCQKTIQMGGKIHACPWMELPHTGSYTYKGSIAAKAMLENAVTTQQQQANKKSSKTSKKSRLGTRP